MTLFAFHFLVVVLGVLSMGFQLLGSRLLAPHFGSSIIVWAWLISTFLLSFSLGSMLGGWISSRERDRQAKLQLVVAVLAIAGFAFTAFFGNPVLEKIEIGFPAPDTGNGIPTAGLFVSCLGLFFLPVTMLSAFGPQCVQFLATRGTPPGAASGTVYGVSTVGNIGGVMLTAFALIPHLRVSLLLYVWLAVAVISLAALLLLLRTNPKMPSA